MKKKGFLIIIIIFSSLLSINCSVSCVDFSISCIKSHNLYENNVLIENKKMEMVNSDYNEMKNCLFENEVIPLEDGNNFIYIQNFDDHFIGKPFTYLGNREVEEKNFLLGAIEYSISVSGSQLRFDYSYKYDFYSNVKSNSFRFSINDSDTLYFEKSEIELFCVFFDVINDYFELNYDFVDMVHTNQNIAFIEENLDLNKYKANIRYFYIENVYEYEFLFDIDVNNELSIRYEAYQESGKSVYRKDFLINVYEKMGNQ